MSNDNISETSEENEIPDEQEVPTDLIHTFIKNQEKELENASQKIQLRELNEKNAYNYACRALEAQKQDRKDQRTQSTLFMKYGFWLTIVVFILMTAFVLTCIYTDNVKIIVSVLKVIAYILPSAVGGYFIGLNRGKKKSDSEVNYAEDMTD